MMANDLKRSSFDYTPPSLLELEKGQRRDSQVSSLPGEGKFQDSVKMADAGATENIRRGAKDSATVLEKVQEQNAINKAIANNRGIQLAQFRQQQQDQLEGTLLSKAQIEVDNRRRYQEAKSSLQGASTQNLYNAATGLTTAAIISQGFKGNDPTTGIGEPKPMTTATTRTGQNAQNWARMQGIDPALGKSIKTTAQSQIEQDWLTRFGVAYPNLPPQ